ISAVPAATPVTTPLGDTVAIPLALVDQLTIWLASAGSTTATSLTVSPVSTSDSSGTITTLSGSTDMLTVSSTITPKSELVASAANVNVCASFTPAPGRLRSVTTTKAVYMMSG